MDGDALTRKASSGAGKAVLPVTTGIVDAGAATSSARVATKATLPGGAAAGAADAPAAATAVPGGESNGGGEEEEEDVQVERFYALLDSIRAMRGAYGSGDDGTGADDGVVDTGGRGGVARVKTKRLRGSEPPWRPAFRLEDFAEPAPTSDVAAPCAKKTRGQEAEAEADGEGRGGARPAVAAVVRVRLDSGRKIV